MKPIGLRLKNIKQDPYTGRISGELMIVHLCLSCSGISCNRIAGDDNPYQIVSLLENSNRLNKETVSKLINLGIKLLTQKDRQKVLTTLFGYDFPRYLK